jgi:hypothetical protein
MRLRIRDSLSNQAADHFTTSTNSDQHLNAIATDYERDGVVVYRQLFTPS